MLCMRYGASTPGFHRTEIIHRTSGSFAMSHATSLHMAIFRCQQTTALTPVVTLHLLPLRPCSKTTISCNIAPCKSLWPSTVCQACSVLHCRFAHLVNYGGSYYSYAYAMCLASSVWEKLFQDDPLSRHAGTNHLCVQQSLLSLLHCHAHCNSLPQQHVL